METNSNPDTDLGYRVTEYEEYEDEFVEIEVAAVHPGRTQTLCSRLVNCGRGRGRGAAGPTMTQSDTATSVVAGVNATIGRGT